MENRCRRTGGHASFTQTNSPPQACALRQPVACGPAETCQTSWRASPLKKKKKEKETPPPTLLPQSKRGVWRPFSTYASTAAPAKVCVLYLCVLNQERAQRAEGKLMLLYNKFGYSAHSWRNAASPGSVQMNLFLSDFRIYTHSNCLYSCSLIQTLQ